MYSQLWKRIVEDGNNDAFKNTMDNNLDFISRLSIQKCKHPQALHPHPSMHLWTQVVSTLNVRWRTWNILCVCVEGLISSVNHPGWVSLQGRDGNHLSSGKSEQGNKVLKIRGPEKDYRHHVCPSLWPWNQCQLGNTSPSCCITFLINLPQTPQSDEIH